MIPISKRRKVKIVLLKKIQFQPRRARSVQTRCFGTLRTAPKKTWRGAGRTAVWVRWLCRWPSRETSRRPLRWCPSKRATKLFCAPSPPTTTRTSCLRCACSTRRIWKSVAPSALSASRLWFIWRQLAASRNILKPSRWTTLKKQLMNHFSMDPGL